MEAPHSPPTELGRTLGSQRPVLGRWLYRAHMNDITDTLNHLVLAPSRRIRATSSGASNAVKCPLWRSTMSRAPGTDSMLA